MLYKIGYQVISYRSALVNRVFENIPPARRLSNSTLHYMWRVMDKLRTVTRMKRINYDYAVPYALKHITAHVL